MNKKRLEKLAEFLLTIPKEKFKMSSFMREDYDRTGNCEPYKKVGSAKTKTAKTKTDGSLGRVDKWNIFEPVKCQTAGCALGWAATIPSFKRAGLVLGDNCENTTSLDVLLLSKDRKKIEAIDFEAAEKFFDIPMQDAYYFFDPGKYDKERDRFHQILPRHVSKRIKKYIKENGRVT